VCVLFYLFVVAGFLLFVAVFDLVWVYEAGGVELFIVIEYWGDGDGCGVFVWFCYGRTDCACVLCFIL